MPNLKEFGRSVKGVVSENLKNELQIVKRIVFHSFNNYFNPNFYKNILARIVDLLTSIFRKESMFINKSMLLNFK